MNSATFVVAKNTYIEMIRDRVLYFVVIFSILFMALCFALGQLSYKEIFRLSVSLGLSGIHLCFIGLAIFLGCSVFFREIEKKTIYTLLARPINRGQYLFGKYLGLLGILLTLLFGFLLCFTGIELLLGMPIVMTSYYAFIGFIFEAAILLAVTFFFSSFAKPFLSISGSMAFFLIGHWVGNLEGILESRHTVAFGITARAIQKTFPDLEHLNWRAFAIAKEHVPVSELVTACAMASVWALFFFMLALVIFRRKDFE
jgi:ABC-type transport system involved in multi-copper enzyme maturation permease subunit